MSEFDFIHWITRQQQASGRVMVPAGDDMAVLRWAGEDLLLVAVDQVIDGVHFDSAVHSPRQIGKKVMNRNLSDCAAMACLPAAAVASVALPRGCGQEYAQELYLGMHDAGAIFGCSIVGGDTASWEGKLVASVTILGRSGGIAPVKRAGARLDDWIYVTGALGGSILGRHMDFVPRVHLARELAGRYRISAMIDISDGLSRDLLHICNASHVGAEIEADRIPIHADAKALSARDGRDVLEHALHDGEDHELVFCSADEIVMPQVTRIGRIIQGQGIMIGGNGVVRPLDVGAWEHKL